MDIYNSIEEIIYEWNLIGQESIEIGTKLKVELKKNFARRLIGILKVENIKIAISYFNSFLNLDFVDSFFKTIYTPRNFFKRALGYFFLRRRRLYFL